MRVQLSNQQSEIPIRVRPLLRQLKAALPLLPRPLPAELEQIQFVLIDRASMMRVHADFLGDPTETDVITFPYGEILICPAVAKDRAAELGVAVEHEILLYGVHGLLHLAGYDDITSRLAREMSKVQSGVMDRLAGTTINRKSS